MSNHTSSFKIDIGSVCSEDVPVSVNFECDTHGDYIYVEAVILEEPLELYNDDNDSFFVPAGQDILHLIQDEDLDNLVDKIYKNF